MVLAQQLQFTLIMMMMMMMTLIIALLGLGCTRGSSKEVERAVHSLSISTPTAGRSGGREAFPSMVFFCKS